MAVAKTAGHITKLSEASLERIRDQEDAIVQSLLDDVQDADAKVRMAARKDLIALGFQHREEVTATSVISLLLDKAKKGEYGEQARTASLELSGDTKFDNDDPQQALDFHEPVLSPVKPPTQFVPKQTGEALPVPAIALGQMPPKMEGTRVKTHIPAETGRPKAKPQTPTVDAETAAKVRASLQASYDEMSRNG